LLALYQQMHLEGERLLGLPPERTFTGGSLLRHVPDIKELIDATGARTLLDYGSGKGQQYAARNLELPDGSRIETLADYWGGAFITSYDPAYEPLSRLPVGRFDGGGLHRCPRALPGGGHPLDRRRPVQIRAPVRIRQHRFLSGNKEPAQWRKLPIDILAGATAFWWTPGRVGKPSWAAA
jgi:hypothetical protein